jgi:hypothetical protein
MVDLVDIVAFDHSPKGGAIEHIKLFIRSCLQRPIVSRQTVSGHYAKRAVDAPKFRDQFTSDLAPGPYHEDQIFHCRHLLFQMCSQ